MLILLPCAFVRAVCAENQTSDQGLSSPSSLGSPGLGLEGLNRRRKKRTSIETNIRVALEKSFLEVCDISNQRVLQDNAVVPIEHFECLTTLVNLVKWPKCFKLQAKLFSECFAISAFLCICHFQAEPKTYLWGDHHDRGPAQYGKRGDPSMVL